MLIGVGPWLFAKIESGLKAAIDAITMIFGLTVVIHLILSAPTWMIRKIISRVVRLQVA
jgi:hypothetical protein